MNEKSERSRAAWPGQAAAAALAGMVIYLSFQVVALKDERQRLIADAEVATRAFTRGYPLPNLRVAGGGGVVTLDQLCAPATQLVILFTDVGCAECAEVEPLLGQLARRTGVRAAAVYGTSFPARTDLRAGDPIRRYRSSLDQVARVARVNTAPSVIVADGRCEISAAGSGLTGSRLVLERALAAPASP